MPKMMNALILVIVLWIGFSFLHRTSWVLPIALTCLAVMNVAFACLIREAPGMAAKLGRRNPMRAYLKLLCHLLGDEFPNEATATVSKRRLLLRTVNEYRVAGSRAKKVFRGQDAIIDHVLDRIRENQSLREKRRDDNTLPLASFVFVGSEGLGKRYLARVLAKLIYGSGMIDVFDCSRIGSSAMLGTNEQPGELVRLVRQRSHRAVVFERVEKADEGTANVFVNILSTGQIRLAGARTPVGFTNMILFFLTTKAAAEVQQCAGEKNGGSSLSDNAIEVVQNELGNAKSLLNAVTGCYFFQPISDVVRAEVLAMEMHKECRSHHVDLVHVEAGILASQVFRVEQQEGLHAIPQLANRLLRKPLVAATAEGQKKLALRVARTTLETNKPIVSG